MKNKRGPAWAWSEAGDEGRVVAALLPLSSDGARLLPPHLTGGSGASGLCFGPVPDTDQSSLHC
jgi:hypothetical protein